MLFEAFLKERFEKTITRNSKAVTAVLRTVSDGDNKQLLTKQDLYIYIPKRFEEVGMAKIEDNFHTIGFCAMVTGESYGVQYTPNFMDYTPSSLQVVKIGEDDFFELLFEANTVVMPTLRCFKDPNVAYLLFNELLAKPNMCTFFSYDDALLCMVKLGKYAKLSLDKTNVATEIIISSIARNSANLDEGYRHVVARDKNAVPEYLGLRNVQYGVSNLTTSIMGSYSDIGIDSILVNPAKKVEKNERLLRM